MYPLQGLGRYDKACTWTQEAMWGGSHGAKLSDEWIAQRIGKVVGVSPLQAAAFENTDNYTRHVIQVVTSTGDGKIHREELETARSDKREVQASKHIAHKVGINNFTNVFTEAPPKDDLDSTTQTTSKKRRGQK